MNPPRLTAQQLQEIELRESRVHLPDRRRLLDELAALRLEQASTRARLEKVLELLWRTP